MAAMKLPMTVRRALPEDAEAVAQLAAKAFHDAFAEDNNPDDMEAYMREAFTTEKILCEIEDPKSIYLLAIDGDAIGELPLGYAKINDGGPKESVPSSDPIEICRIYARPDLIGRGVGAALMQACLDEAQRLQRDTLWLGVWEHNTRAVRFYERWGFRVVGEHSFILGNDHQTDMVMALSIA